MSTIYLVRHGQASFGTDNYDQLSETGREQVRQLGNYFAGLGERIDRIYSGGLRRQTETAEIIAGSFAEATPPIALEPAFNEYDSDLILHTFARSLTPEQLAEAGWPGLRTDRRKFQFFLERAARAWVEAQIEAEEMTPWRGFHGRIVAAMENIMRSEGRSKTLIVSTSGGVIGTIVAHVMGLSNHLGIELNWAVHNASITRLIYSADKVSLSLFNGLPHLDRAELRHLITYR
ncbi:histidine phosphatase family protein [Steroidobacter agaridevorans]|uniref:histidine phosphatase family protein n=1 Tax=Steroidobacter agaridevorans TaxID=2695856 RepID=UPI00132B3BA6|nr:histidine phosphatase family protein [Steroidobacter agaridevorans]GFE90974.1 histidine phosphatase family protein [Steroidobacter agaridevorans]